MAIDTKGLILGSEVFAINRTRKPKTGVFAMKRKPSKRGPSEASLLMWDQINELWEHGFCSRVVREWPVASGRRWRYDFAFPEEKLAIEIDGAIWSNGRHTRGSGRIKEFEKFNMAALLGWQVLHFTPQQVLKGEAIDFIKKVLEVLEAAR